MEEYQPMTDLLLDEFILNIGTEKEHSNWRIYSDGAVNIHGIGIGVILISLVGAHYLVATKLRFSCTNSTAEYEACIAGLEAALDMNVKDLEVYRNFILIISQSTR